MFLGLLAAMLALLVAPGLIGRGLQAVQARRAPEPEASKKTGVRLRDQPAPRVRLH